METNEAELLQTMADEDSRAATENVQQETLSVSVAEEPPKIDLAIEAPLPIITKQELKDKCPVKCPKCGTFVENLLLAEGDRFAGSYCNKEGCGWSSRLPGKLPTTAVQNVFGPSTIELVRLAPLNEEVRAHIHSLILMPVPRCCKTFEQIMGWAMEAWMVNNAHPLVTHPAPPRRNQPSIEAEVAYEFIELGTCEYSCRSYGTSDYEVTQDEIGEALEELDSWDSFVNTIKGILIDKARENTPETDSDRYEYQRHEQTDSSDEETTVIDTRLGDRLAVFVREHFPDQAARLLG